jgi:hypothetical protein
MEIIYNLLPSERGKGYATEAAKIITVWAIENYEIPYIIGTTEIKNIKSQKVLENCGYKYIDEKILLVHIENNDFFVFDLNLSGNQYEYKMDFPSQMSLPNEILAAFPLESYEGKMAAVVTHKAFDNMEGIVFIFHEFVHCFQYYHIETLLKRNTELKNNFEKIFYEIKKCE